MSIPFVSVTMLEALFGHHSPGGPIEALGAVTELAWGAGYRPGPRVEWIAEERGPRKGPDHRQAA